MSAKFLVIGIQIILLLFNINASVLAEPMFSLTPEDAALRAELIVIANYIGYSLDSEITYFRGPIVNYKIIRVLKGNSLSGVISVRYSFSDSSACISPKDWKFSEGLMPQRNSRWILFLEPKHEAAKSKEYMTYRGDSGRWPASEENIQKVIGLLDNPVNNLSCAQIKELMDKERQESYYDCETDSDCIVGGGEVCGDCLSKDASPESRENVSRLHTIGWKKECWASPAEVECAATECACINNRCTVKDWTKR